MIRVRVAHPGDAGAITAIYAAEVLHGTATFELEPPGVHDMLVRMAASAGAYPWLVAELDGAVLGYAYAAAFHPREAYRPTVETSVYVAAAVQGRGTGRTLYAALLADLADRGFRRAVARIALPHPASVALHEAAGFRAAGVLDGVGYKHGRWIDVGFWQRPLGNGAG